MELQKYHRVEKNGLPLHVGESLEPSRIQIYKYIPMEYLISSLKNNNLYLSSPEQWDDPFEVRYKKWLEKENDKKKDWKVYGTCFTQTLKNEEAEWRLFKKDKDLLVRLTINYLQFKETIQKRLSRGTEEGLSFYLTQMNYQTRENIVRNKPVQNKQKNEMDLYIGNFSIKRDSYSYEEELRFCALDTKAKTNGINYDLSDIYWKKFIYRATLEPRKDGDYSDVEGKINELSKYLGISKLFVSTLYDTTGKSKIEKMYFKKKTRRKQDKFAKSGKH